MVKSINKIQCNCNYKKGLCIEINVKYKEKNSVIKHNTAKFLWNAGKKNQL